MEPNPLPDWSEEEIQRLIEKLSEEVKKDECPGLSGTPINMVPFRPKPSIPYYGNELAYSMSEGVDSFMFLIPEMKGISVTSITPPDQGWPVAMYCPICKVTTFVLSPWAVKPEDGDYWRMTKMCADYDKHNLEMSMPKIEFKPLDPYAYRPIPGGYVDATGPHRGSPPTQQDAMQIYMMHRHIFSPYDLEFTQEIPIEEAKKRWPNEPIPGEEK